MRAVVVVACALVGCSKSADAPDAAVTAGPDVTTTTAATTATSAVPDAAATPRHLLGRLTLPQGIPLKLLVTATSPTAATLDIPLQGLTAGALTDVAIGDDEVRFTFAPPGAPATAANRFTARRVAGAAPARWEGEVAAAGVTMPLVLTEVAGPEALVGARPQTPRPPFPYATEDVRIAVAGAELGCTLSLPTPKAPLTAVLFLTGSGVQDRDETIFEHKPFLVLADALARAGIASLRCDDRGAGQSSGDPQAADATVFIADAEAALAWLRGRIEIDADRIGLLGHSEGGMTAAAVARKADNRVAFVVSLAGPGLTGREVLVRQNRDLLIQQGVKPDARDAVERAVDAYFLSVEQQRPEADVQAAAKALAELVHASLQETAGPQESVELMTANFAALAKMTWLRGFLAARPAEDLAAARADVLALFGGKDTQVHAADNAAALEAAAKATGKTNVTIEILDGRNHLFQEAATGALAEYDEIEQTMDPRVVERIVSWIGARGGAAGP
ncbi:MAG: alpha/beta fold hydrolase [Deltaproteobacteria bacterium]|nr:alpha/beta fold hydrolase [Deltaproteobacteria bacterium]